MKILAPISVAVVAAMAAAFVLVVGGRQPNDPARKLARPAASQLHLGCRPFSGGATNQRLCPSGVVYTIQGGEWAYTGPATPRPRVRKD